MKTNEKDTWDRIAELLGNYHVRLGDHWSYNFYNDPKRLGFVLSRYKFAAKMACKNARVLELGCSSGIGAPILAETAKNYTGVDLDQATIEAAYANLKDPKFTFILDNFLGKNFGEFDAIISLDVIEHIEPSQEDLFFKTVLNNLSSNGICVIGTPNITASAYASRASQIGHINLYSYDRLHESMQRYFHQVFPFGMNDEIMHTGFGSMAHYLMHVGFYQK